MSTTTIVSNSATILQEDGRMVLTILSSNTAAGVLAEKTQQALDAIDSAADTAMFTAGMYPDTATGLINTTDGEYFSIPSPEADEFSILYQNVSGSAVEKKRFGTAAMSQAAIDAATAAADSETAAAGSASAAATSAGLADADRIAAEAARDATFAAAQASGVYMYDTKAAANAAVAGLPDLTIVEVLADESQSGARTRYRKESGSLVFKIALDKFLQSGTGAVARTVQGKLREIVTPEDFGAVGDGVTDDTTALRKWADASAGLHYLGDPSKTYLVAPPFAGDIIIPLTAARRINGGGAKIKVKSASGQFFAIIGSNDFGVDLSGTVVSGVVFDHNKSGNTYTVTSNVLDNPHFTFVARNGSDIDFVDNTVVDPVCTNCVFINGVSAGVPLVNRARVNRNRFLGVGGSATAHDHSTIYITGDDAEIIGNYGRAAALGATGVACFIEPHSTRMNIAENQAYDFDGFANITGVYSCGDTVHSQVSNNRGLVLQFGIRIFSAASSTHSSGYGIDGLDVCDNQIRVFQSQLAAGSNRTYIGIGVQSGATLPVRNIRIRDNTVEYDLESVTPSHTAVAGAVGVLEASQNQTYEGIEIEGNTIINAPGPAIVLGFGNGTFINCRIGQNRIINPTQSLSSAISSYKAAVWLGGNLFSGSLKIGRQSIVDNNATTRLQFGIYAGPVSDSTACVVEAESDITLTGDGASFTRSFANTGNKMLPVFTGKLNKAPAFTSHTFKAGSTIEDTLNSLTYRVQVQGSTWTSHGFATAAPVSGTHNVGSTRTNTAPAASGNMGWVCVTAGVPGVWKTFGTISA